IVRLLFVGIALTARIRAWSRDSTASELGALEVSPLALEVTAPVSLSLLHPARVTAPAASIPIQYPVRFRIWSSRSFWCDIPIRSANIGQSAWGGCGVAHRGHRRKGGRGTLLRRCPGAGRGAAHSEGASGHATPPRML